MKTLFKHDCDMCHYLGPWGNEGAGEDLWIHLRESGQHELIHRYDDEGDQYGCMPMWDGYVEQGLNDIPCHPSPVYKEIYKRAMKRGLI